MSQYSPPFLPAPGVASGKEAPLETPFALTDDAKSLAWQATSLALLDEYGLRDEKPDAGLDALIRLAASLCQTPLALLTVAGPAQQWIKAHVGADANLLSSPPVCCYQAATQRSPIVGTRACSVPDEPDIRFWAAVPLISPDDQVLGVLCVLDTASRPLTHTQEVALLGQLTNVAQAILEHLALRRSLTLSQRAEQLLRGREQQSTAILHGALDAIITIDHLGLICEWNPAAERTFGYPRHQALGQPMADLIIPARLRTRHLQGMAHCQETGTGPIINQRIETIAQRADGREIIVELAVTPIQPDPQKPPLFTGYVRDITEQKRNKAALQQACDDLEVRVHERTTQLARANAALRAEVRQRTLVEAQVRELNTHLMNTNRELTDAYDTTIEGWARALDLRDEETEGHSRRVTEMAVRLADALGVPADEQQHLRRGALLHDIGKVGIPDHILRKPGPLTEAEWVVMRRHPEYARNMLESIAFLRPALDIPYCHHERWDGSGYPRGLQGEAIPSAARIFSVVDVWDALRSDRPYRDAWPDDKVRAHLEALSGVHFDPTIVRVFLALLPDETPNS